MKNTMKKAFLLLALVAIVAGGVFAQRVGDTVQIGGQAYTIQRIDGNDILLRKVVGPLDGVWQWPAGSGYGAPRVITFSGNTAVINEFTTGNSSGAAAYRGGQDRGLIKVGDPLIRNIQSTGTGTWSCEIFINVENNSNSTFRWNAGTITMQPNGRIAVRSGGWIVNYEKQ